MYTYIYRYNMYISIHIDIHPCHMLQSQICTSYFASQKTSHGTSLRPWLCGDLTIPNPGQATSNKPRLFTFNHFQRMEYDKL